ncbi:citrate/2-methylcitrate synthase [Microbacterium sp. ASV49]|uniref:citrate synthase (unknown stereospecificity) n=1 Tax=Microbacterium candidum TaxID=3041922 RepID=A0ABT7MY84_9MICO|nr:citrate/2-methylcitrate synthase [Microbacterium sp. ASV49]MDL9979419.1 citrate/2-methylcitrate synthase [Microbacterium sp. ASV49]
MDDARLTAAQAAARLGVKPQTLYAYVSRGWLARERDAHGSTFDPLEIEAFAAQRTRRAPAESTASGSPLMVLDTDVALIEDDELFFRGMPAKDLARMHTFDAVAAWLWGEPLSPDRVLAAPDEFVRVARTVVEQLPAAASWIDRAVVAVRTLAIADPLRDDVDVAALGRVGEVIAAGLPRVLGGSGSSVPDALWHAIAGRDPSAAESDALNAAMVLSIDHDLAVSTFAGRVAASARGSGYAVVTAALGAFDSPLHGTASHAAAQLIASVVDGTPADRAIRTQLKTLGRRTPGFGQPLYRGVDARAAALLEFITPLRDGPRVLDAVAELRHAMRATHLEPNVDLALGALTVAAGLPDDAGALVFAVARSAGWIAHAQREYAEPPLRLRPRGRYIGPR